MVGVLRLLQRFPRLLFWVVVCVVHLSAKALWLRLRRKPFLTQERAWVLHHWSGRALRATGTVATVTGKRPLSGVVVANHTTYLDILLMAAATPVVYVSKVEVAAFPLVGQTAALAGTIFIDRKQSVAKQDVACEMDETLVAGTCVAFFPEGTTSSGRQLLRFRAALFGPPIRLGMTVHTAAFRYTVRGGGDASELVSFWKDHRMVPHLLRLLMLPGVEARLEFGPSFLPERGAEPGASRAAANRAQELVRGLLVGLGVFPE